MLPDSRLEKADYLNGTRPRDQRTLIKTAWIKGSALQYLSGPGAPLADDWVTSLRQMAQVIVAAADSLPTGDQ
jgi:hypothetical protein